MLDMTEVQYVSDVEGNNIGVIVPIELWRELAPLRLRYRVYTHSGDAQAGHVAEACEQYRAEAIPSDIA